jgi:hypothetical protein
MSTHSTRPGLNKLFVGVAVLAILLTSLACSIDLGNGNNAEELALQQTAVALQQTQNALENAAVPTEEPPTQQPVAPVDEPDVIYEGISFSFDPNIAQGVNMATVPGQNMGEDYMPGETYPTYFEFTFNNYAVADHFHTPKIVIYPVDEYRTISASATERIDALQQAIANHPAGGVISNLPFLPMWPAAQMFSAQVGYFDFQNGSGVRYLTMYGQAIYPVDNQNLFYTYQGLTNDGRYYISAVLPVVHLGLPDDGSILMEDDYMAFEANWETYINETVNWLNAQEPGSFFPGIDLLDAMMASFMVDR